MIKAIYTASKPGEALQAIDSVQLRAGKGVVGDRNFNKSRWPGQNLTFIEREKIEAFNQRYSMQFHESDLRRTVITEGVDLNALEGKEFSVGNIRFYGVELCEPCKGIGERLANEAMTGPEIVRAWVHKAGLRTNVLDDGVLRVGEQFA